MAADGGGWQYRLREQRRALLGFLAALQPLLAAGMMRAAAFERERERQREGEGSYCCEHRKCSGSARAFPFFWLGQAEG